MFDLRRLELKADLYAKAGEYNHARSADLAAKAGHAPPETMNEEAATCNALAQSHSAALDTLLEHLAAQAWKAEREAEMERAFRFKELINREPASMTPISSQLNHHPPALRTVGSTRRDRDS